MRSLLVPGEVGPIHIEISGPPTAPPLVLVHGMAGNCRWWDGVVPLLAEEFHVVAMDFRGHGDSAWARPPRYEIGDYAQDIESVRHHFGWKRFHLGAHSMGARAALHYAGEKPEKLGSLALVDFLTDFNPESSRKFRRPRLLRQPQYSDTEAMVKRFRLEPDRTLLGPEALETLARACMKKLDNGLWTWKFDWQAFTMVYMPVWPLLPLLHVPSLLVRGEHSEVMPHASYIRLLNELKGSVGVEIPKAHHHVPLDTPRTLAGEMLAFLKTQPVFL